jgi:hypothetical protein
LSKIVSKSLDNSTPIRYYSYIERNTKPLRRTQMKTSLKNVKITARYAHKTNGKLNGLVTYAVRSSDGSTIYCTTLIRGEASACSCPSRKPCYHMIQLTQRETARQAKAVTVKIAKSDVKATIQPINKSAKTTDIGTKGHLNVARAFSLMR